MDSEIFTDYQKITERLRCFEVVPLAEIAKLIERFEKEIAAEGGWQRIVLLEHDLNALRAYHNLILRIPDNAAVAA